MRLILAALILSATIFDQAAHATPNTRARSEEAVEIPFDPPEGESLSYRSQATDTKDGVTTMRWSVDRVRFEREEGAYKLIVEPESSGSNEKDPRKIRAMKALDDLTRKPFVLRLNDDAEIVELEQADEYWSRIIAALREALTTTRHKPTPEEAKAIAGVTELFEKMPPEVRLAKLTETLQPLVEFAYTSLRAAEPIRAQVETSSPYGGTLKHDVVISLAKVDKGIAYLTIRQSLPRTELDKLITAFLARLSGTSLSKEDSVKVEAAMAALKDFRSETVADYRVSLEDGMLESLDSRQTITVVEGDKKQERIKTLSLARVR